MKRILALVLIIILIFSLSSCSKKLVDNDAESQKDVTTDLEIITDEVTEDDDFEVAMFWRDLDAYGSDFKDCLEERFVEADIKSVHYDIDFPSNSADNFHELLKEMLNEREKQVDEAIANGADVLYIELWNETDEYYYSVCDKAKSAGIPIIFSKGLYIPDEYLNYYENTYDVETIFGSEGTAQGELAGEYILENYDLVDRNKDGYISYVLMKGELGCPDCERHSGEVIEYCNKVLTDAGMPEMKFYDPYNTDLFIPNGNSMYAYETFMEVLTNDPIDSENSFEVIIARYDYSALQCVEALNEVGFNTGEGDFIPIFGTGGYELDAIESGKLTGSVSESITNKADIIIEMLLNAKENKDLFDGLYENYEIDEDVKRIYVPFDKLTKQLNKIYSGKGYYLTAD